MLIFLKLSVLLKPGMRNLVRILTDYSYTHTVFVNQQLKTWGFSETLRL